MNDQARKQGAAALIVITVVGCLISMLSSGIRINYGLISTAIENHTGIAAASVSFAIAIAQLLYGFAQPFFGALALKKSNSMVLIIGALMLLSGFLLTPLCRSAGVLDLSFGILVGGGTGAMAFGIIMGAVTPILGEKKAAAVSGIINGAGGIGGSILSPVTQALMDAGRLRAISACFMILSGLITVVCVWLFTQERGAVKEESQEKPDEPVLKQIGEAVRSRDFLHAALAFFTCGYFFLIFLGLIGNSTVPPTSNLISKLYGVRKVGLLLGTAFVFHQIGSFISTWLGGVLGANGQYLLLWVTGAVLATAAALLCYTVKEPAE